MKPDIRESTVLVIEKNGEFLRIEMLTGSPVWDRSLSGAWKTRNREKAKREAEKYGGRLMLFNPVIWKVREACFTK